VPPIVLMRLALLGQVGVLRILRIAQRPYELRITLQAMELG
jgi:hypothetical protein